MELLIILGLGPIFFLIVAIVQKGSRPHEFVELHPALSMLPKQSFLSLGTLTKEGISNI